MKNICECPSSLVVYLRKSMDMKRETTEIHSTLDAELPRLKSSTVIKKDSFFTFKEDQISI